MGPTVTVLATMAHVYGPYIMQQRQPWHDNEAKQTMEWRLQTIVWLTTMKQAQNK